MGRSLLSSSVDLTDILSRLDTAEASLASLLGGTADIFVGIFESVVFSDYSDILTAGGDFTASSVVKYSSIVIPGLGLLINAEAYLTWLAYDFSALGHAQSSVVIDANRRPVTAAVHATQIDEDTGSNSGTYDVRFQTDGSITLRHLRSDFLVPPGAQTGNASVSALWIVPE